MFLETFEKISEKMLMKLFIILRKIIENFNEGIKKFLVSN